MSTKRSLLAVGALLLAMAACSADRHDPAVREPTGKATASLTSLDCSNAAQYELSGVGGALFNTLAVDTAVLPMWQVGKTLANDQIHMLRMATNAGLSVLDKHVPAFVIFDDAGKVVRVEAGGFYQCTTLVDCQRYLTDVVGRYRLNGTLFTDRPEFHGSFQGHAYAVIGAAKFQDVADDYAIKITRWRVRSPSQFHPRAFLAERWANHMRETACRRGTLAQAHLLWSEEERVVAEVTIGTKIDPPPGSPTPYFVQTLGALAGQDVLEPLFDRVPLDRIPPQVTDTYLVLTYWPSAFAPSRWPNSASTSAAGPLPEPFCGDGACNTTVSHAEDAVTCPADCAPGCGNGTCDPGESADTCAIDCPP